MIDALIVGGFLGICLYFGGRERREERAEGWILAGRTLTLPSFVATLVPTFYGGVLGIGEFTWTSGLSNWTAMALPYYVFALIYAFFMAGRVRLTPGLTIPDHLESAYGRPMALLAAALVFVIASPADEMLMAGTLLSHLTGLHAPVAAAICATIALALIWNGGLRSDVAANRLQFVAMFAGFALILPPLWRIMGNPAAMARLLPPGHLTWTGGLSVGQLVGWWLIAIWTIVDPSFHQRCAAAESPSVARNGILISILFWALFDVMTTLAGLYARAAMPALPNPTLAFPLLADRALAPVMRGFFFAGISASLFAALQGTALLAGASLGQDGFVRAFNRQKDERSWLRVGLLATMVFSYVLSLLLPSVVGLWYAVGSASIPGLLAPMIGVYSPRWRISGPWAFFSSALGTIVSLSWLAAAHFLGAAPLGLEPMLPGLCCSLLIWIVGLRVRPLPPRSS